MPFTFVRDTSCPFEQDGVLVAILLLWAIDD